MKSKKQNLVDQLKQEYLSVKPKIAERINQFDDIYNKGSEEDFFKELLFCILTPQSKAFFCWDAIQGMCSEKILYEGNYDNILKELAKVRFKYKKTLFIMEAQKKFYIDGNLKIKEKIKSFESPVKARDWLVTNIKGYGYKEASHFLRNIGLGQNIAILDRHILKNMVNFAVIDEIPKSISKSLYLDIENKIINFAQEIGILPDHLDLLLWYRETGEVFK